MTDDPYDMPDDERALFERMSEDFATLGKLSTETELSIALRPGNELLPAMRQADQELTAELQRGDRESVSDLDVMELAWSRLTTDQQEKALHNELFGCYRKVIRDTQERLDLMTMAKLDGSSFLDGDDSDLDVIAWAGVMTYDHHTDSTVEVCKMRDVLDLPENGLPEAYVPVPVDTLWRLVQEIKLLRFRQNEKAQA
jgi:hypothetical protein